MSDPHDFLPEELRPRDVSSVNVPGLIWSPVMAYSPFERNLSCPICEGYIYRPEVLHHPPHEPYYMTANGWCFDWLFSGRKTFQCPDCGEHLTMVRANIDANCPCCGNETEIEADLLLRCLPRGVARYVFERFLTDDEREAIRKKMPQPGCPA